MAATVTSALRWWARTNGDATALIVDAEAVDYRALQDWTSRAGRMLVERGVRPGDRVGVLGANSLEWCAAALGVLKAVAVLVPLNARMVAAELRKVLADADARMILADPTCEAVAKEVVALTADLEHVSLNSVADLRGGGPDDFVVDVDPDAPTMVIFTSCTT
jgi:fatty-acyl-CoA synthase